MSATAASRQHLIQTQNQPLTADLQESFRSCALDACDRIQGLAMPLPPANVGQHVVAGLQSLHQQAVIWQRWQGSGALDLKLKGKQWLPVAPLILETSAGCFMATQLA